MVVDPALYSQLNSFSEEDRLAALKTLEAQLQSAQWQPQPTRPWVNLHAHTFHSFNADGWSPARLVAEAKDQGLEVFGTVDFDVLDATTETMMAGDMLQIKTTAGLETRIYIPEYGDKVMNSPGEPGVSYFMLTGCYQLPEPGTRAAEILDELKQIAQNRNRSVIEKVNAFLGEVQVDYQKDLLTMSPSGNPTERHLVQAYDDKAREVFGNDSAKLSQFWSEKLGIPQDKLEALLADSNNFKDTLRSKLMKRGGVGYVEPDPSAFPRLESMVELGNAIGALPTATWLDGTNPGEDDMHALLSLLVSKGVVAVNVIPDRNWNIADPDDKQIKLNKLKEVIQAARDLDLPVCMGTELNKAGLPFVDNFAAPELAPYIGDFLRGAYALFGHTVLARTINFGWMSTAAEKAFGNDRKARFDFYAQLGEELDLSGDQLERLRATEPVPSAVLKVLDA